MTSRILGPPQIHAPAGVDFDDHGDRLVFRANNGVADPGGRSFAQPAVFASFRPADFDAPDVSMVGFAYTQFALPVRAGPGQQFDFRPSDNLRSPAAVMPLLLSSTDGRVELLAPLDAWHDQIIAVRQEEAVEELRWGWQGDLERVDSGFETVLGIFSGTSVDDVFHRWGATVRAEGRGIRPAADSHELLTHLSYWTDNGAAYWYRTEDGLDITTTLATKLAELDDLGLPVTAVELDSWFYPHEMTRSVSTTGYLEDVPPTGMLSWTPRSEVLPEGVAGLRTAIGDRPLVLHSRHISPLSHYLSEGEWWVDRTAAHPADPSFFQRWCDDAAAWGATCIEQDWMMVSFFANRELRAVPGRATDWQRGLDDAAGQAGIGLLWCMALPGDYAATVGLDNVIAVRTCDDYRFADDPATLWVWYLTVNRLADALGLPVFKDCFFSSQAGASSIDGDPHAELEALLAAMSAGVVGIGDRIGRTSVDVVLRTCRPDGRLVGPDRPITLAEPSFIGAGLDGSTLCWADTESSNRLGTWRYVVAINTSADRAVVTDSFALHAECLIYDWRSGAAAVGTTLTTSLAPRDWALFVCCPISVDDTGQASAIVGDPSRYATMGHTRVDLLGSEPKMLLADGEPLAPLLRWSDSQGLYLA